MFLLEDVTGAGKTEAALTLAYRLMAAERGLSRWADWPDVDESKPALYELVQDRCLGLAGTACRTGWIPRAES